jgi:PAS domain S-box-containing protein
MIWPPFSRPEAVFTPGGKHMLFTLIILVSLFFITVSGVFAWQRRAIPGAKAFACINAGEFLWVVFYFFEHLSSSLSEMVFFDAIQFIGSFVTFTFVPIFAVGYLRIKLPYARILLRSFISLNAVLLALCFVPAIDANMRIGMQVVNIAGRHILCYDFGPVMKFELYYMFAILAASSGLLIRHALFGRNRSFVQAGLVALGFSIPVIVTLLGIFSVISFAGQRDVSPLTFGFSNMIILYGLLRHHLFDPLPVAKERVLSMVSDSIVIVDSGETILFANPAAVKELCGGAFCAGKSIAGAFSAMPALARCLAMGEKTPRELELTSGGETRHFDVRCSLFRAYHAQAMPLKIFVFRDITHFKLAQNNLRDAHDQLEIRVRQRTTELEKAYEALRTEESRFREMADSVNEVFFLLDCSSHSVSYISPASKAVLGLQPDDLYKDPMRLIETIHPDDRPSLSFVDNNLRCSTVIDEQFRVVHPDGNVRWVQLRSFPVIGEQGITGRIAGVISDITENKEARIRQHQQQQQIVQADKLASLGLMISGIAHEINNPNNLIMLNSDVLKTLCGLLADGSTLPSVIMGMPAGELQAKINKLIDGVKGGSVRIQKLVQNLKDFARVDNGEINQLVNIREVLESAIAIAGNVIRKSTDIFTMNSADCLPCIRGSSQKLEQVMLNLIINACQALADRSQSVEVSASCTENRDTVIVRVRDLGAGISDKDLPKIFDPFFTTKQQTGGTGLGLSVSYGIVKEHGGSMEFSSAPGSGTTVTVFLPASKEGSA